MTTLWPFLLLMLTATDSTVVEAQTAGGENVSGTVVQWDAQTLVLKAGDQQVSLPVAKLARVAMRPLLSAAVAPSVWVTLVDGSTIVGSEYTVRGNRARVVLAGIEPVGSAMELGTDDIQSVRLRTQTEASATQWTTLLESPASTDLLVIQKEGNLDYHKGTLAEVNAESVQFTLDGEAIAVKRTKVYGMIYRHPAGRKLPEAVAEIGDVAGSIWRVQSAAMQNGRLEWTTLAGVKTSRTLGELKGVDYSRGNTLYLGGLAPLSVEWTPYLASAKEPASRGTIVALRRDQSLEGGPLMLGGKSYLRGLALHSRSTVVYRLDDRFERFQAIVGIDDRVRPNGHVHLVLRGDDRVLFETDVAGADAPKPLDVPLGGARRLTILVDFGNDMDIADHLDLAEARVVK